MQKGDLYSNDADTTSSDTSSDNDLLPIGWEEGRTSNGRKFFINHNAHETQWSHPKKTRRKLCSKLDLPFGWSQKKDDYGTTIYICRRNNKSTYIDPRLAFNTRRNRPTFNSFTTAMDVLQGRNLTGGIAIVTGSTSGIGFETARALAVHGAVVVIACRDVAKGSLAAQKIVKEEPLAKVDVMHLELSSLRSISVFVEEFMMKYRKLHIVVCNAAVLGLPWQLTEDGLEYTYTVNYIGHFYLMQLFTELLIASSPARVVVVSSESHRFPTIDGTPFIIENIVPSKKNFIPMVAYNQTKLCNILLSNEFNRKYSCYGVTCNAVHPGNLIPTSLSRNSYWYRLFYAITRPFAKSIAQGAATTTFCAGARELNDVGGSYFNNCQRCEPSPEAQNEQLAIELWNFTDSLIGSKTIRLLPQ